MLKFYDSVDQPIFYIGPIPLYAAFFHSKYNQWDQEGTNLAEFHPRMTTIVLNYKVKWCMVTTAGHHWLYAFTKWPDNISTQTFLKIPKNSAFPNI